MFIVCYLTDRFTSADGQVDDTQCCVYAHILAICSAVQMYTKNLWMPGTSNRLFVGSFSCNSAKALEIVGRMHFYKERILVALEQADLGKVQCMTFIFRSARTRVSGPLYRKFATI